MQLFFPAVFVKLRVLSFRIHLNLFSQCLLLQLIFHITGCHDHDQNQRQHNHDYTLCRFLHKYYKLCHAHTVSLLLTNLDDIIPYLYALVKVLLQNFQSFLFNSRNIASSKL